MELPVKIIGRAENVRFTEWNDALIPARIDTGAKTSSVWASNIVEHDGRLSFVLFEAGSTHYTGNIITTDSFQIRAVASSNGAVEQRYAVKLLVELAGRKIRAYFTLANRSTQVYPVLVGRNVLRGKFLVDVKAGTPDAAAERLRSKALGNAAKKSDRNVS